MRILAIATEIYLHIFPLLELLFDMQKEKGLSFKNSDLQLL